MHGFAQPSGDRCARCWRPRGLLCLLLAGVLASLARPAVAEPSFTRDIKSLLSNRCLRCHGPDAETRQGGGADGLRLDTFAGATADLGGHAAIVPGDPVASVLLERVAASDPDLVMPPPEAGAPLTPDQINLLKEWIAAGGGYEPHWSYLPPSRPPLPAVRQADWPRTPVDRFVLARLESEGLAPQPEADRATLARRLAIDLTGLPLAPEEVDRFVADSGAEAVERLVERLLVDEGAGEHQARQWLDLARYADSTGFASDAPREIWAYRDWVIEACDTNLPFDQFTIRQLAGDLLPGATRDDRIATAFHRNTLTNTEGGTVDEEFRAAAVVDRVNTTMSTWMGTTMACCQCHDHKYDPLSQREYFGIYAIFNQTADTDRNDDAPLEEYLLPKKERQRARIERDMAVAEAEMVNDPAGREASLMRLEAERKSLKPVRVPVMVQLPADQQRVTKLQRRGNYLDLGPEVAAGVPVAFGLPAGPEGNVDRLALAKWLVDRANPLTARVAVNRIWERLFGIGLVATSEEFGSQGELPSHRELLDWLAVELIERGWDLRAITRLIVTSAAYRQRSVAASDLLARDPENRLVARGPRVRLTAEVVRDQALAAAGLLSRKKGGPSVHPPQPNSGLSAAFGGGIDWKTSSGENRYRRAIYTTWRRSNPYPSMALFDAPTREVCSVRRPRTNTPLQALVTLNDPVYVEAAQALARRMVREGGATAPERAGRGFRLVLSRFPEPVELDRLVRLHDEALHEYQAAPEQARQLATEPLGPLPSDWVGADLADLAAWTVVANVILNLDETFQCP